MGFHYILNPPRKTPTQKGELGSTHFSFFVIHCHKNAFPKIKSYLNMTSATIQKVCSNISLR